MYLVQFRVDTNNASTWYDIGTEDSLDVARDRVAAFKDNSLWSSYEFRILCAVQ